MRFSTQILSNENYRLLLKLQNNNSNAHIKGCCCCTSNTGWIKWISTSAYKSLKIYVIRFVVFLFLFHLLFKSHKTTNSLCDIKRKWSFFLLLIRTDAKKINLIYTHTWDWKREGHQTEWTTFILLLLLLIFYSHSLLSLF